MIASFLCRLGHSPKPGCYDVCEMLLTVSRCLEASGDAMAWVPGLRIRVMIGWAILSMGLSYHNRMTSYDWHLRYSADWVVHSTPC